MGGTSQRFSLARGIRHGCPASPYLFLIVAQLLSYIIKASTVKGISIMGREISITQLTDDSTLLLKNEKPIPVAIEAVMEFSMASGLCLNIGKCEFMAIKECTASSLSNIPVKNEVIILLRYYNQ